MAEVHIIGQVFSAAGFPDNSLFCRWSLHYGGGWKVIAGATEGQTQTDKPEIEDAAYFCHPVDIHLATRSLQGWPKMHVQIWHFDAFGRQEVYGYGFCHVPTMPGEHTVECVTWRPIGSARDEVAKLFVGGGLQLQNPESVFNSFDRSRLRTVTMGTVILKLGVILRNFDKFGIDF